LTEETKVEVVETSTQTDIPEPEVKKKRVYKKRSKAKEQVYCHLTNLTKYHIYLLHFQW